MKIELTGPITITIEPAVFEAEIDDDGFAFFRKQVEVRVQPGGYQMVAETILGIEMERDAAYDISYVPWFRPTSKPKWLRGWRFMGIFQRWSGEPEARFGHVNKEHGFTGSTKTVRVADIRTIEPK